MTNREQFLELEKIIKQSLAEKEDCFEKQNEILKELVQKKDLVSKEYEERQNKLQRSIDELKENIIENSQRIYFLEKTVKKHKNRFSLAYLFIWASAILSLSVYATIKGM